MTCALILAGTRVGGDPFAKAMGVEHKGLLELAGEPLLLRVLRAVRQAGIDNIAVSCNTKLIADLAESFGADVIPSAAGPSASVLEAFDIAGSPMLVTTSDHGLLKPQWVRELIENTPERADLSVMMAERSLVQNALPDTKRTYWRFADGHWSGCNLFYLKTPQARRAIETWSMVEVHRKRPWRIAANLGPGTLLSLGLGRLTFADGLTRLGNRIGINASLVAATDGLAAVDVDKPADLEIAQSVLQTDLKSP